MNLKFKMVPPEEFRDEDCLSRLDFPFATVKAILSKPYCNGDDNYPDDPDKTDVCWCVKSSEGYILTVWN